MRKQTGSRNRGWLPAIRRRLESYGGHVGNRLSVAAGVALVAGMMAAVAPRAEAVVATGGTVTNYTSYGTNWTAHIFTSTAATSIVFSAGGNIEVLLVGGGGAGRGNGTGGNTGSGGSAGQLVYIKDYSVSASSYPIIVGLGGPGVVNAIGSSGSNSVFGSLSVNGSYIQALGGAGGTRLTFKESDGGNGAGGAGVTGGDGGAGGKGLTNNISGSDVAYAGGGGGGNTAVANGGVGGGGRGETWAGGNATAGTDGLGGGGGGVSNPNTTAGKNGGSGIVIVRYTTPSVSVTPINSFFVNGTTPISATATVYGDSPPFTVKFYTNSASGSYAQAGADQGPATGPSFSVAMTGFANNSTNHIYAVVVDSVNKTNTSSINTFFLVPNNLPISPYQAFCVGDVRSIFTNNVGRVYAVHQYTNTANLGYFVPSTSIKNVEVLLVGGGGGGGYQLGGGGGAGGLVWISSTVTAQSYLVEVGKGGVGGVNNSRPGGVGGNSVFNFRLAYGGGGGGGGAFGTLTPTPATTGGSGGGGSGEHANGAITNGAAGILGQGNAGGYGTASGGFNAGGGGGAGAVGGNGVNGTGGKGGDGGVGVTNSFTGIAVVYAGGGGGGGYSTSSTKGFGGSGGGGDGSSTGTGISGTDGLGGGGGGGGYGSGGGAGGSGIVILRYDISPPKGTLIMMR